MSNSHLRDRSITLKAKGLLSLILSLPDGWGYSLKGLATLSSDKLDSTRAALNNLEEHGYIIRRQLYDKRGRFAKCEYTVYERPQRASPPTDLPSSEKPTTENPSSKNASSVKPTLLNTNEEIIEGSNTDSMNHPSLNLDRMDGMDERSAYKELIKENIGFDNLLRNYRYDHDRLQEIVDIILDVVCSCAQTIRINGEDIPVSVIKSRYLKLNDSHIEYVIDSMAKNPSDIRNIRAYIPFFVTERKRSEAALIQVVQEAFVQGVSTRKMEKLTQSLGIENLSSSQVSEMTKGLNEQVNEFRNRTLSNTV